MSCLDRSRCAFARAGRWMEWLKRPFPVLVCGMRPVEKPPVNSSMPSNEGCQSSLEVSKRPMTSYKLSGSANWHLGVEGKVRIPPGGVVLLHNTRRALNEGAWKAAHSLEPHQSPAAPQAVQSPWTTGLLCIVRFGASVVRIACSAQWASGPAPVPGISPCATRHWPQFSLAGDAQASRRDDGRAASALLLDSSPPPLPPPFSLDSHRTQTTIASPIPPNKQPHRGRH